LAKGRRKRPSPRNCVAGSVFADLVAGAFFRPGGGIEVFCKVNRRIYTDGPRTFIGRPGMPVEPVTAKDAGDAGRQIMHFWINVGTILIDRRDRTRS